MLVVVDYGMGNLRSVEKALIHIGGNPVISADPRTVERADQIVLPGVGAFDHAVRELQKRGLFDVVVQSIRAGKPYLGLCLGLQLLFGQSEEGKEKGFGILDGVVKKFPPGLKVPHMGWNQVNALHPDCPYWKDIRTSAHFYFVHSYYVQCGQTGIAEGKTEYGVLFDSAVWKDNIFAVQFHPEKSQKNGLRLLQNYLGRG